MKKKILSLVMVVAIIMSFAPVAFADEEVAHKCGSSDCIVCDLAEKINALPEADAITVDNAATVTDQIHAIDRIRGALTDEQYDELLTLVQSGNDGSGYGIDVPVRYVNAVKKIQTLGGNSLYAVKKFVSADGKTVNVDNAQIQISVTNTDTNVSQTFTMSSMDYIPNSLSANSDFYSENKEGDGWTYKYILPAGTYRIEEVSYSGATVGGAEFITTEVTYNGKTSNDGFLVTFAAGADDSVNVGMTNTHSPQYNIDAKDKAGNSVKGVSMSIQGVTEPGFSHSWETDGYETNFSLRNDREYTLTINSVPGGYEMPETTSVTFVVGNSEAFTEPFALENNGRFNYKLTVTIAEKGIEIATMADAGYYSATKDSEDKVGVIVMNACVKDIENISKNIVKYGMFLYKGGKVVNVSLDVSDASDDISLLVGDKGYYHVIINNIAQEEFSTAFFGVPFIVMDPDGDDTTNNDVVITGEVVSATVADYSKWLGTTNPY